LFLAAKHVQGTLLSITMEAQRKAPRPKDNDPPPDFIPVPEPERRLGAAQRIGIAVAVADIVVASVVNSPLGASLRMHGNPPGLALYWILLAASLGSVVCAAGLILGRSPPAWYGVAIFLAVALMAGAEAWYAVPPAMALLACVALWERSRPPAPPAPPRIQFVPYAWPPAPPAR